MAQGIEHSKNVIADLGKVATDIIDAVKHGAGIGAIKQVFELLKDGKDLVMEAKKALPEVKDLDGAEDAQLAEAAYEMVQKVVSAIAA